MLPESGKVLSVIRRFGEAGMARHARNQIDYDEEDTGSSLLGRSLMWGGLAVIALGGAALSGQSETGAQRLYTLLYGADPRTTARVVARSAPTQVARSAESEAEAKRLAESVKVLAADRDRLLARLDALERNIEVTGSVPNDTAAPARPQAPQAAAPMTALPPNWSMTPSTIPPAAGVPSATLPPLGNSGATTPPRAAAPAPSQQSERAGGLVANEQAAESTVTRTEFGVDIGGKDTLDALRTLWSSLRGSHGTLFESLRPLVAVREGNKPDAVELRLIAGPLPNAVAAARLCATLSAAGVTCQPTVFDGQRLALR
jgi:hypothetical protein